MYRHSLLDELRRIEHEVVEGERQAAELEAQLVALKRKNGDLSEVRAALETIRQHQQHRERDRQRLLSLLHPSKLEPSTPPDVRSDDNVGGRE
jgi:predicted  nucleic acid-binding Zn-ribbon protein